MDRFVVGQAEFHTQRKHTRRRSVDYSFSSCSVFLVQACKLVSPANGSHQIFICFLVDTKSTFIHLFLGCTGVQVEDLARCYLKSISFHMHNISEAQKPIHIFVSVSSPDYYLQICTRQVFFVPIYFECKSIQFEKWQFNCPYLKSYPFTAKLSGPKKNNLLLHN